MLEEEKIYVRMAVRVGSYLLSTMSLWVTEINGETQSARLEESADFVGVAHRAYETFDGVLDVVDQMITTKKAFGQNVSGPCENICKKLEALIGRVRKGPYKTFKSLATSPGWRFFAFVVPLASAQISLPQKLGPGPIAQFIELRDDLQKWVDEAVKQFPNTTLL